MATVRIGNRDLGVARSTLGMKLHKIIPWQKKLADATTEADAIRSMVDILHVYLGHNRRFRLIPFIRIGRKWILDHAPASDVELTELMRQCVVASGAKVAPPGEAASQ